MIREYTEMPLRHVPVYVDEVDSSVYAVFVTSTGLSDINMPNDGYRQYRQCKSVMDMGYCVATHEQVNALEIYISQYGLRDLDIMAFPDGSRRPAVMQRILQNGHDYEWGKLWLLQILRDFTSAGLVEARFDLFFSPKHRWPDPQHFFTHKNIKNAATLSLCHNDLKHAEIFFQVICTEKIDSLNSLNEKMKIKHKDRVFEW